MSASVGVSARRNLASIDVTTGLPTSLDLPADLPVRAVVATGTSLLVGGDFTTIDGQPRARLAEVDLPSATLQPLDGAADAPVLTLLSDGADVVIGGDYTTMLGSARTRVAHAASATGVLDAGFDPGADGQVRALARSSELLWLGGAFITAGGVQSGSISTIPVASVPDPLPAPAWAEDGLDSEVDATSSASPFVCSR